MQWTPFYVVIRRVAHRNGRIASADAVLHAEPPADRVAGSLDATVRLGSVLSGFAYRDTSIGPAGWQVVPVGNRFIAVQPRLLSQGEARQRVEEQARTWGGFGLVPEVVELWRSGDVRMHERRRFVRSEGGWIVEALAP